MLEGSEGTEERGSRAGFSAKSAGLLINDPCQGLPCTMHLVRLHKAEMKESSQYKDKRLIEGASLGV